MNSRSDFQKVKIENLRKESQSSVSFSKNKVLLPKARLLWVGHKPTISMLDGQLRNTNFVREYNCHSFKSALRRIDRNTKGIFLVPPLPDIDLLLALNRLNFKKKIRKIPVFVIVGKNCDNGSNREFYEYGATAVFNWEIDGERLEAISSDLIDSYYSGVEVVDVSEKLLAPVHAVFQYFKNWTNRARLKLKNVMKNVFGHRRIFNQLKERSEDSIFKIPEISHLIDDVDMEENDYQIKIIAQNALREVLGDDARTISLNVTNESFVVFGSCRNRLESQLVVQTLLGLNEVNQLTNLLVISNRQKIQDIELHKKVTTYFKKVFPSIQPQIKVSQGNVILTCEVENKIEKRKLKEELVDSGIVHALFDESIFS